MDDADRAGDNTDKFDAAAIAFHSKVKHSLIPVGHCHSCGEVVVHGMLFCDRDCRDDYDAREAARKRNGL